jgi:hypothetical protein
VSTTKEKEQKANKPESLAATLRNVCKVIRLGSRIYDPYMTGAFDFYGNKIYLCWYYGELAQIHEARVEQYGDENRSLPEPLRAKLLPFLEDCAQSRAAFFRRDQNGYVWCVCDMEAYRACCERHGMSEKDYLDYPKDKLEE